MFTHTHTHKRNKYDRLPILDAQSRLSDGWNLVALPRQKVIIKSFSVAGLHDYVQLQARGFRSQLLARRRLDFIAPFLSIYPAGSYPVC